MQSSLKKIGVGRALNRHGDSRHVKFCERTALPRRVSWRLARRWLEPRRMGLWSGSRRGLAPWLRHMRGVRAIITTTVRHVAASSATRLGAGRSSASCATVTKPSVGSGAALSCPEPVADGRRRAGVGLPRPFPLSRAHTPRAGVWLNVSCCRLRV
jgi:hypothetical protein